MRQETAETIALQALGWLAEEELLGAFLGASGAALQDVPARAQEPEFLAAVLDFLLMEEARVRRFCAARGLACEAPMQARGRLPGGEQVNWT